MTALHPVPDLNLTGYVPDTHDVLCFGCGAWLDTSHARFPLLGRHDEGEHYRGWAS